ncbi:hypothetical protein BDU57DRAFT_532817 [Ampelomyces quisqualis]|uniref:Uncharacterized protein n=1 Tax=Ampelomyces quisqualis TaxID=50730 RepID=A0A6A5QER1_AMPQU|nr:hypothetical protein BDU57DRAFT_532817 [Ampelomyces quisqualis]
MITEIVNDTPPVKTISQRPSFRRIMTEPVSQPRKRKWVPSRHCSPPPDLKRSTALQSSHCVTETEAPYKHRRRKSSTTERVLETIKSLFRRDSQNSVKDIAKKTMKERRNTKHGDDSLERLTMEGMRFFPGVNQYFDRVGESGPSNYYEQADWVEFQDLKKAASECQDKSDQHSNQNTQPSAPCEWSMENEDDIRNSDDWYTLGSESDITTGPRPLTLLTLSRVHTFIQKLRRRSGKSAGKQPYRATRMELSVETLAPASSVIGNRPHPTGTTGGISIVTPPSSHTDILSSSSDGSSNDFSTSPRFSQQQQWQTDRNKHSILASRWHYPHHEAGPVRPSLSRHPSLKRTLTKRPDAQAHHLPSPTTTGPSQAAKCTARRRVYSPTVASDIPQVYVPTRIRPPSYELAPTPTPSPPPSNSTAGHTWNTEPLVQRPCTPDARRATHWLTPTPEDEGQMLTENMMFSMSPLVSRENVADIPPTRACAGGGELRFDMRRRWGMVDCAVWVEGVKDWIVGDEE